MLDINFPHYVYDLSLLLIRVILALAFIVGSYNKSKHIRKFAKQNGLPPGLARLIASCEFLGGNALLLGILPQLAALGIMLLMLNTMFLHIVKWRSPYWAIKGGWEYDLTLFTLALVVLLNGAGAYTLF